MPTPAMEQLLADGKADALGRFEGSPVRYMDRWWRANEGEWEALDESASAQLDLHAERYRAATAATAATAPATSLLETDAAINTVPASQPEAGAA
ncbi:hypothetical protein [Streptomyces sp. NPDC056304]|uniref:hypothetical protein n=1 Tax=Streptomyces sp. NPDC056304 TaxID=3345778 RepID=UPI0035E0E2C4